ncbi:cell envelope integrity EipB family protein [Aerophototrophica crusticola]|uniref:Cell envelope integrity EipB family protein n=1 Tax=Aerophototrophica crusticola TaxID=1709002 RepID=A0A858R5V1_9PROT|nr:cell envelope integrity EipB family protein [Rhodospirillaceae bacterium B3]
MTKIAARPKLAHLAGAAVLTLAAAMPAWSAQAVPDIAPHLATYKLSLASARSQSPVSGVDGKMTFAWNDSCDAWTIEQRFQVNFIYAEGEQMELNTSYATWEAKDGRSYRFNVKKLSNGELEEELRGEATLDGGQGGVARFSKPEAKEVKLAPGTMFPTAHTLKLLAQVNTPETFLSAPVFDGAESDGPSGVGALIGKPRPVAPAQVDAAELLKGKAWQVFLAFFPTDPLEALPEYETSLVLLENGVVRSMVIDYGEFKVDVELESLERRPKGPC